MLACDGLFVCLGKLAVRVYKLRFLEHTKRDKKYVSDGTFVKVVFSELLVLAI